MSERVQLGGAFVIGFIAAVIGAISGGGGLLSIPFLLFLGLPPHQAIATNKISSCGFSLTGFLKFLHHDKIIWSITLPFIPLAILGGVLGSKVLLLLSAEKVSTIIGICLLVLLPVVALGKHGLQHIDTKPWQRILGAFTYTACMFFGGFFGGGSGTLLIYNQMFFYGLPIIKANANNTLPVFCMSVTSTIIYAIAGAINYKIGVIMMVGSILGTYLGVHLSLKKGNARVRNVSFAIIIAAATKILFF